MNDLILYFAALIMVLFGVGFYAGLQGMKKLDKENKGDRPDRVRPSQP
jgi:hypothetical protein